MPKTKCLYAMDMELLYNIARELGLAGDEFRQMFDDLMLGVDVDVWCDTVSKGIYDPDKIEAFHQMIGKKYFRTYSVNLQVSSSREAKELEKVIDRALSDKDIEVLHFEATEEE